MTVRRRGFAEGVRFATSSHTCRVPIRAMPPGAGPRPRASRATPPVPHGNGRGRRRRGRSRHAGNSKVTPRQYRVRCTSVSGKDTETLRTRLSRGGGPTGHRDSRQRHVSLRSCSRLAGWRLLRGRGSPDFWTVSDNYVPKSDYHLIIVHGIVENLHVQHVN